jgi:3-phenylpropionate/trans-cinnamate dioxygenase ferredoxin subunit
MSDWTEVGKVDDVVSKGWLQVNLNGTLIVAYHIEGKFYAVEDICTHDGAVLSGCPLEGDEIICPRHGARFSVKTGKVTAPPAWEDIHPFPVKVEKGNIFIKDDRWD